MDILDIEQKPTATLWRISIPLMISYLSMFAMIFFDRLFLAHFSSNALAASASAGNLCWAVNLGFVTLASMAEIFVAQYNGAKKFEKLAEPMWQMIWLSAFSILFFIPAAIYGGDFLYQKGLISSHELIYFKWNTFFSPMLTLLAALSSFYIGRGKSMIITWMAFLGNGINIILDPILIFGIGSIIPSMGIKGAAIATGLGISIQALTLFYLIIRKKNREAFGTSRARFDLQMFKSCLRVGLPPALFVTFELIGWTLFYWMMSRISDHHILVASVCQSILFLFLFFGLGLEKGIAAVAGNAIGASKSFLMNKIALSGAKLIASFSLIIALFFVIFPEFLMSWFLQAPEMIENLAATKLAIKSGLLLIAIYILGETARWMIGGMLTAAGDTLFLMFAGTLSVWLFMLLPVYFLVYIPKASMQTAYVIMMIYSLLASLIYLLRFMQGKWKEQNLIEENY